MSACCTPPPVMRLYRRPMKAKLPKRVISAAKMNLNKFWDHLEAFEESSNNNNNEVKKPTVVQEEEMSRYSVYLWEQMKKVAELQRLQKQLLVEQKQQQEIAAV